MTNLTDDLILNISRACDQVRSGISTPEAAWLPLELVLPADEVAGFMFMGAVPAAIIPPERSFISEADAHYPDPAWVRQVIFRYKHGITRRYLNLGSDLRPYYYVGNAKADDGRGIPGFGENVYAHHTGGADPARQLERAIDLAFHEIEKFGATRSTAYNADYIAARNAKLVALGYRVVS